MSATPSLKPATRSPKSMHSRFVEMFRASIAVLWSFRTASSACEHKIYIFSSWFARLTQTNYSRCKGKRAGVGRGWRWCIKWPQNNRLRIRLRTDTRRVVREFYLSYLPQCRIAFFHTRLSKMHLAFLFVGSTIISAKIIGEIVLTFIRLRAMLLAKLDNCAEYQIDYVTDGGKWEHCTQY